MKKLAPTLYAMRYLKVTGKLTAETEEKGYKYMREGKVFYVILNFWKKKKTHIVTLGKGHKSIDTEPTIIHRH